MDNPPDRTDLAGLQRAAYRLIADAGARGATSDEIAAALGKERFSMRPRCAELRNRKSIIDSGQRRRTVAERDAIVWIIAPAAPG